MAKKAAAATKAGGRGGSPTLRVIWISLGIFVFFFLFGILQEKITRSKYGADGERFHFTFTLVLVQCVCNAIFSRLVLLWQHRSTPIDTTRKRLYFSSSVAYLGAMLASNYALQFVNYPTQVLGKSCKPIPVMILGVLFANKRYPALKYLFVVLITFGCGLFMYNPLKADKAHRKEIGFGELLLVVSLTLDGVTGAIQERMRANHQTTSHHMMLWMNIYSSLILAVIVGGSGELGSFVPFIQRYPEVLYEMLLFAICSALGQYFIFQMVSEFGPLPLSIVTTTRKFFSVLFSVILFQNPLTGQQWFAATIVFAGLLLDAFFSKRRSDSKSVPAAPPHRPSTNI